MLIQQFSLYLQHLGYSKNSIYMLPKCVTDFLVFTGKTAQTSNTKDILNYYVYLQNRPNKRASGGLSESYIYHHIFALKLFFSWQLAIGELKECPISGLEFKPPSLVKRAILSLEEIQILYAHTQTYLEKALLGIYYGCGLRRVEGEKLNIQDVDLHNALLYVREGKGAKSRVVPMGKKVSEDLKNYLYLERLSTTKESSFLINKRGLRLSGALANKIIKSLMEGMETDKKISLHNLRHSIASHLLQQGLSMEYVRDFLGHSHLESTQVYLQNS